MRAQFVDRGEAHHAFRHLGLDRTVGIERIGHAIDDARLQHRHRRLILGFAPVRRWLRASVGGMRLAAPLRRHFAGLGAIRSRPGIVERRGRRFGRFDRRGSGWAAWGAGPTTTDPAAAARRTAPARARALSATSMRTTDCASALQPAVAVRDASARESGDHAGHPRSATAAVAPERRRGAAEKAPGPPICVGFREAANGRGRNPAPQRPPEAPAVPRRPRALQARRCRAAARCSSVPGPRSRARA